MRAAVSFCLVAAASGTAPAYDDRAVCAQTTCRVRDGHTIIHATDGDENWHCENTDSGCVCMCHPQYQCTIEHHASFGTKLLNHCKGKMTATPTTYPTPYPTSFPTAKPTPQPTSFPTKFPTKSPLTGHWGIAGNVVNDNAGVFGNKLGEQCISDSRTTSVVKNSYGHDLGVTCCKDVERMQTIVGNTAADGNYGGTIGKQCIAKTATTTPKSNDYGNKMGVTCCDKNGEGSRPGCASSKTFAAAEAHCAANGLGLCSIAQIEAGAGRGTGCSFDAYSVWTKDSCSTEVVGSRPGCAQKKTFGQAKDHCSANGMRLCSRAEITSGKGRGTGCSHDARAIWTSDKCDPKHIVQMGNTPSNQVCKDDEHTTHKSPGVGADDDLAVACCQTTAHERAQVILGNAGKEGGCHRTSLDTHSSGEIDSDTGVTCCKDVERMQTIVGNTAADGNYGGTIGKQCIAKTATTTPKSNDYGNKMGVTCCDKNGEGSRPGCASSKTFAAAEAHCAANGLGLCSIAQIEAGAGRGTGCSFDAYSVWTKDSCSTEVVGSRPGCAQKKTFGQAKDHCSANGMRLCSRAEIASGKGRGTGCSHDLRMVWTSDKCENDVVTKGDRSGCHQAKTFQQALEICQAQSKQLCSSKDLPNAQGTGCMHDLRHTWTSDQC